MTTLLDTLIPEIRVFDVDYRREFMVEQPIIEDYTVTVLNTVTLGRSALYELDLDLFRQAEFLALEQAWRAIRGRQDTERSLRRGRD